MLLSNRGTRRTFASSAIALMASVLAGTLRSASALRGWCRSDPLIAIEGELADIFCTAPVEAPIKVTGPTRIVVTLPPRVRAKLVLAGLGFGRGEQVRFASSRKLKRTKSGIGVKIAVMVPASGELPIGVEFAPRIVGILNPARAEGTTNSWITLSTEF